MSAPMVWSARVTVRYFGKLPYSQCHSEKERASPRPRVRYRRIYLLQGFIDRCVFIQPLHRSGMYEKIGKPCQRRIAR